MAFIYAIHDSYYPGCNDGDVDDRAAIKYYDKYLLEHYDVSYIVVYLVGEGRYEKAVPYMNQQTNDGKRIVYESEFNIDEAKAAEKIIICAPVSDENVRIELSKIIREKGNGYCQGDKIGVTNFPKPEYQELLDSIPLYHRFTTKSTSISFPTKILDILDPENEDEYMSYGLIKLFAIGGIIHIPSLIYRLYCPEIGGGPGTNMLKIQELIQKYFVLQMMRDPYPIYNGYSKSKLNELNDMIVCSANFENFNSILLELICNQQIYLEANMKLVDDFMMMFKVKMPSANHMAMENALKVMIYFARMCYVVTENSELLFPKSCNQFYSLSEIPKGGSLIQLNETPPLYDFVVAYLVMNGYNNQAYFLEDNSLTRLKLMGMIEHNQK
jgi:hypothetical protein